MSSYHFRPTLPLSPSPYFHFLFPPWMPISSHFITSVCIPSPQPSTLPQRFGSPFHFPFLYLEIEHSSWPWLPHPAAAPHFPCTAYPMPSLHNSCLAWTTSRNSDHRPHSPVSDAPFSSLYLEIEQSSWPCLPHPAAAPYLPCTAYTMPSLHNSCLARKTTRNSDFTSPPVPLTPLPLSSPSPMPSSTTFHSSCISYTPFLPHLSSPCIYPPLRRAVDVAERRSFWLQPSPRSLPCHSVNPRPFSHTRSHTHSHSSLSP